jgi:hypothetical protein
MAGVVSVVVATPLAGGEVRANAAAPQLPLPVLQ